MATDLTKMAKEWIKADVERRFQVSNNTILYNLLEAMAAEIEANRKEIERMKTRLKACQSIQDDNIAATETLKGAKG